MSKLKGTRQFFVRYRIFGESRITVGPLAASVVENSACAYYCRNLNKLCVIDKDFHQTRKKGVIV